MEQDTQNMSKRERREMKKMLKENEGSDNSGMMRSIDIWGSVIVVLVLGLIWLLSGSKPKDDGSSAVDMKVSDKDWVKGNKDGKVVLVEYSDLQCPACKAAEPIVAEVLKQRSEVKFVYRHFPLRSIHKNAQIAAQAAEAAGMQGKFFEMHDVLFDTQETWALMGDPESEFQKYAKDMGLDVDKFTTDMKSNTAKDLVEEDYRSGMEFRVSSTPTFYLNGKKVTGGRSVEDLVKLVDEALK
jgi:protein-disulfide isomerase